MTETVAMQSLALQNPHTYADLEQSPRSQEATRTRAHNSETCARGADLHPHSSAPGTQVLSSFSRRTVAGSPRVESQHRLLATAIALVVALALLLVSTAEAKCRTAACWHRVHVKRQHHWIRTHIWVYRWNHVDERLKLALARLRFCESRHNYRAVNGQYTGAYQYSASTWARAGGHGLAMNASPREQDVRTAWFWPSHRSEWSCKA